MALKTWCVLLAALLGGCAPTREARVPELSLQGTRGARPRLVDPTARFTVIEFFSAHCPCQTQHDARLAALYAKYAPLGVSFVAVDSEAEASVERDRAEAVRRGYPYPIVIDSEGRVARALHADYATYVVLVDAKRQRLFRGGIDSDRSHLRDDATPYLADALADAVAGRLLRRVEAKTLGCALMLK